MTELKYMRSLMQWVIVVILIWSTTAFTSCNHVSKNNVGYGDDSNCSENNEKNIWVLSARQKE